MGYVIQIGDTNYYDGIYTDREKGFQMLGYFEGVFGVDCWLREVNGKGDLPANFKWWNDDPDSPWRKKLVLDSIVKAYWKSVGVL